MSCVKYRQLILAFHSGVYRLGPAHLFVVFFPPILQIQQLTETLNSISSEKDLLLAERATHSSQLKEQISSISQEKDELQKLLQDISSERDQLKMELQKSSEMVGVANCMSKLIITYLLERYLTMHAFIAVY